MAEMTAAGLGRAERAVVLLDGAALRRQRVMRLVADPGGARRKATKLFMLNLLLVTLGLAWMTGGTPALARAGRPSSPAC